MRHSNFRPILALSLVAAISMLQTACAQNPEHRVRAYVLMPLHEFVSTNPAAVRGLTLDEKEPVITVASNEAIAFDYRDPKGRFELSFPAVGSPANTTRFSIERGTRLGLGVSAVGHIEFALSDSRPLSERVNQAIQLRDYMQEHGFKPTSYDRFELKVDGRNLTDLRQLQSHVDLAEIPKIGGLHLFALERDELIFDASLIHQHYPPFVQDGYTLHFIIRERSLA